MLRTSPLLRKPRPFGRLLGIRDFQWLPETSGRVVTRALLRRGFADDKTTDSTILPGSQSTTVARVPPVPTITTTSPASPTTTTVIPPENIPRTPPTPEQVHAAPPTSIPPNSSVGPPQVKIPASSSTSSSTTSPPTGTGAASVTSLPPSPPPKPRRRRRFRTFLVFLTTILGISYAGGVYYSLVNDDFHDFFTEYIPFGEDAVLFFEEREFKRRFPVGTGQSKLQPQVRGENKVTIPGKSGVSARTTHEEPSNAGPKGTRVTGSQTSAKNSGQGKNADAGTKGTQAQGEGGTSGAPKQATENGSATKGTIAGASGQGSVKPDENVTHRSAPDDGTPKISTSTEASTVPPEVRAMNERLGKTDRAVEEKQMTPMDVRLGSTDRAMTGPKGADAIPEPSPPKPIEPIDPLAVDNAGDPVVQEIARILNDVIAFINSDNAAGKYSSTMSKAKDDLKQVASDIAAYRTKELKAAEEQIRQSHVEFENRARELIRRVEMQQHDQEMQWKEEYDAERERISNTYQQKLKAEAELAEKIAQQRLRNELLEREINLKESFETSVRDRVETERGGRLSKINDLHTAISELERLTSQWNDVVDTTLQTQHFVVAVESVRSILENVDRPRPFLHELAALKEIAKDDALVNAAISSINPTAYQKGISPPAQIIDRFRRVAAEVRKASLLPEDAGAASHAASLVLSRLMFKKNGNTEGQDVESILTRTEALLEEGNLDEAAREMNGLTGWAKMLSRDWVAECRRALEVKQALDVIATEARLQSLMVE